MNLLYCGCVPVERSCHGSLFLYRLLETWPANSLRIVEGYLGSSEADRRLPGVRYAALTRKRPRLQTTRFAPFLEAVVERFAEYDALRIARHVGDWRVDAVVTVGHYNSWRAAAAFAARRGLPLHFIVHDDWPRMSIRGEAHRLSLDRQFGAVYRRAASRLCISAGMAEEYAMRYGVAGNVLPPLRGRDASTPARSTPPDRPFTLVFAGSIHSPGDVAALRDAAAAAASIGGRLLIFGPLTGAQAESIGLCGASVIVGGMIPAADFLEEISARADALFLPTTFFREENAYMRFSLPSKLADYTLTRRPILLYGPPNCAAAAWSRANGDALLHVEEPGTAGLGAALGALARDPELRRRLGETAGEAGDHDFAHRAALATFETALRHGEARC
ncbi:glycosyltransferase [Methylosinus sp. H3A]|uniref:glycosyltransferase n=1 Tax=Methylosinus sp. H3A TaxID=2785786 RepID=UPI0018C21724|nr:glycosyltransferase [Methylosinus sp. H3A]MBG0811724.1 glycosyltransferase [Methylosinus sp. H3A]